MESRQYLRREAMGLAVFAATAAAGEEESRHGAIAFHNKYLSLEQGRLREAKMHGERPAGLKHIHQVKKMNFDPISQWAALWSFSLLEQCPPRRPRVMVEVATAQLAWEAKAAGRAQTGAADGYVLALMTGN